MCNSNFTKQKKKNLFANITNVRKLISIDISIVYLSRFQKIYHHYEKKKLCLKMIQDTI